MVKDQTASSLWKSTCRPCQPIHPALKELPLWTHCRRQMQMTLPSTFGTALILIMAKKPLIKLTKTWPQKWMPIALTMPVLSAESLLQVIVQDSCQQPLLIQRATLKLCQRTWGLLQCLENPSMIMFQMLIRKTMNLQWVKFFQGNQYQPGIVDKNLIIKLHSND